MRDPLQPSVPPRSNPYDVLGIAPSADREGIQAAYRARLNEGADPRAVFDAKQEAHRLLDSPHRVDDNPHEYDDGVLARLGTTDPFELLPPRRAAVLRNWDAANTAAFPDYGVARALAICSYWSAVHVTNGGDLPGWDLASLWRLAAMCCAMASPVGAFQKAFTKDLQTLAQREPKYADLVFFFSKELATAEMMGAVRLRTRDPEDFAPVAGVAMLKHVGWFDRAQRQVRAVLEKKKGHPVLKAALQMLVEEDTEGRAPLS